MTKVEYAVNWCLKVANDNIHGYSQANRWGPDYDCSSFIISAYEAAGIPVKTAGAVNTFNMLDVFKKCGFYVVSGWNRQTGAGLIKGDVLLNVQHHTEIYIGGGQLCKASWNYDGRQGDSKGNEIHIGGYYVYSPGGWDYALRYKNQSEQYDGSVSDISTSYDSALSGVLSPTPDYTQIKANVVFVDRNTKSLTEELLWQSKAVGLFAEAGRLFDESHIKQNTYVNPLLEMQVSVAKNLNVQYGLVPIVRARSTNEAKEELKWLRIYIQKYVPPLGVWLKLDLAKNTAMNDLILAEYKDILIRSGLKNKMGLYATRSQLSLVDWDKWQDDYFLWLIDHVENMSEIDKLLDPTFFDL